MKNPFDIESIEVITLRDILDQHIIAIIPLNITEKISFYNTELGGNLVSNKSEIKYFTELLNDAEELEDFDLSKNMINNIRACYPKNTKIKVIYL